MKLIVGLGNPGSKYEGTRHNVGFQVLSALRAQYGRTSPKRQFLGETVEAEIGAARSLLLWPHTLMNLSGNAVRQACDFYKLPLEALLVISDDFNLPLGKLRFRSQGSAGGQKGLADIIRALGTEQFARLRIGIGPVPPSWNAADFVLGRFTQAEKTEIEIAIAEAKDEIARWALAA